MDSKTKIIGITFGIRFDRSFRIPDISGEIIDDILQSDKSPFNAKIFTGIQEKSNREKILFNEDTTEYLRINTDDIILGITIKEDFENKFEWLKTQVITYYKDVLFKNYGIKNIKRVGIVFHHKIAKSADFSKFLGELTNNTIKSVDEVGISFSKKLPSTEALYRKGVNDYKNTIYNMQYIKGNLFAELDYQFYYDPRIEDLRECFIEKILVDAKGFVESDFYPWLSTYENKKH